MASTVCSSRSLRYGLYCLFLKKPEVWPPLFVNLKKPEVWPLLFVNLKKPEVWPLLFVNLKKPTIFSLNMKRTVRPPLTPSVICMHVLILYISHTERVQKAVEPVQYINILVKRWSKKIVRTEKEISGK